jgi:putative hydrolase of the HAD superfamily
MAIRAVIFDIGGVLEITPKLGVEAKWEPESGAGFNSLLSDVWRAGSVGTITLDQVHERLGEILGAGPDRVSAFLDDIWTEYLGTLNVPLVEYWRALHGPYATGIVSNSFVGAREREEAAYKFSELADFISYSHEVGVSKPGPLIYQTCLDALGVRAEEAVFLDDAPTCIEGAQTLGMHAVRFEDTAQAIAEIDALLGR